MGGGLFENYPPLDALPGQGFTLLSMEKATPKQKRTVAEKPPVPEAKEVKETTTATETVPPPLPSRDSVEPGNERISVKISDGKLDRESFRAASAEKIKNALKASLADPEFRSWIGMSDAPQIPAEELFSDEQFGMLLDVLVKFEVVFMAGRTGLTSDEVADILGWTAAEHKIMDAQGARIIRRYVPAEWLSRLDLWIFILTFLSLTAAKMKRVTEMANAKLEAIGRAKHPEPPADAKEQKAAA